MGMGSGAESIAEYYRRYHWSKRYLPSSESIDYLYFLIIYFIALGMASLLAWNLQNLNLVFPF